ncbi:MAG: flagella basal body P-ring formation protein FlgA [Candidatus Latescibacterota bacterium]|nr:MAG: flagella basal body P-ring formation protein FlgA [Candidatus Latescibacterota bacterium]
MMVIFEILLSLSAWGGDIQEALEEFFRGVNPCDQVQVHLLSEVPVFDGEFRIVPPETRARGNLVVYVEKLKDGVPVRRFPVRVSVRTFGPVLMLRHRVNRHHRIVEGDVVVVRTETTFLPEDVLRSLEEAVGLRTKRIIRADTVLRRSDLESPPAIRRGDRVRLRVVLPGIWAEAEGEAKADGWIGSVIPVRNIVSGKVVRGRVVDERTVEVILR